MNNPLYDVLVFGGGCAGIAAAVAAARERVRVGLVERYGFLGGLATGALVGTVCGLYPRSEKERVDYISGGFPKDFAERLKAMSRTQEATLEPGLHFLPYDAVKFQILCQKFMEEELIDLFLHSKATGMVLQGSKPSQARVMGWNKGQEFRFKTVIDCTGEASIAALCQAQTMEADCRQAAAMVFSMAGLETISFRQLKLLLIKELKKAIRDESLPPDCERLTIIPGSYRGQWVSFKLGLPYREPLHPMDLTELECRGRLLIEKICGFLRQKVPVFSKSHLSQMASQVGIRTGRRPVGLATLTEKQVLHCQKFKDGVARGSWPIEIWGSEIKPKMKYFAPNDYYEVPSGALQSVDYDNLFFAGRSFSATEEAIASARVMGTCLATGYAAGKLAAYRSQERSLTQAISVIRKEQCS